MTGARKPMRFKPSLKQTYADTAKGMAIWSAASGKPTPAGFEAPAPTPVKARQQKPKSPTAEASVMTDIADVYKNHPNILFAVRQNSGSAERNGVPVWFWKWMRRNGVEMTLTDTWGMLLDGRMFAIEAKRPGWKGVGTGDSEQAVKERRQQNFINVVKVGGGVGGFVTSAEDAIAILSQPLS